MAYQEPTKESIQGGLWAAQNADIGPTVDRTPRVGILRHRRGHSHYSYRLGSAARSTLLGSIPPELFAVPDSALGRFRPWSCLLYTNLILLTY
ncbi:hypothetical protein SAMN03159341_11132 [Paenibacillus sp. 1_12]|nr:hypothetical protein SAMN03159341_11132 [Paenibacillus sp. 1_12]